MHAQVGALREVIPQHPIHVLVRAPLPPRSRVTEKCTGAGHLAVTCRLGALISGNRTQRFLGRILRPRHHRSTHTCSVAPGHMQQPDHAGTLFVEGADRGQAFLADEGVALLIVCFDPVGGRSGTVVDGEHGLLETGRTAVESNVGPPVIAAGAQWGLTVRCQSRGTHRQRSWLLESLIDTLMAQVHYRIVEVLSSEMTADLFRAPPLRQQLRDRPEQLQVDVDPSAMVDMHRKWWRCVRVRGRSSTVPSSTVRRSSQQRHRLDVGRRSGCVRLRAGNAD